MHETIFHWVLTKHFFPTEFIHSVMKSHKQILHHTFSKQCWTTWNWAIIPGSIFISDSNIQWFLPLTGTSIYFHLQQYEKWAYHSKEKERTEYPQVDLLHICGQWSFQISDFWYWIASGAEWHSIESLSYWPWECSAWSESSSDSPIRVKQIWHIFYGFLTWTCVETCSCFDSSAGNFSIEVLRTPPKFTLQRNVHVYVLTKLRVRIWSYLCLE